MIGRVRLALPARLRPGPALLSLLDQGAVSGFGFLSGLLAARLVGIEEFGRFTLALIAAAFAQGLHNALVTAPLMTLSATQRRAFPSYAHAVLRGALGLSVATAGAIALLLLAFDAARADPRLGETALPAAALALAGNMQFTLRRLLFAAGRGGAALAMDGARVLLFPVALAAPWLLGRPIDAAAVLWCLAGSAALATLPALPRAWLNPGRRVRLAGVAARHWRLARWLLPVVFVTFGQEQFVYILAGLALGDDALGGLRAAQYLVGLVLVLLAATENVVPTAAGRAQAAGGDAAAHRYLRGATLRVLACIAPLLLLVAVPAEFWLARLFGPAFAPYAPVVWILAGSAVLVLLRDMASHAFRARERTGTIFRAFAASFAVSAVVAYPLLSAFGVVGAAAVVAVGHATSLAVLLAAMRRPAPVARETVPC